MEVGTTGVDELTVRYVHWIMRSYVSGVSKKRISNLLVGPDSTVSARMSLLPLSSLANVDSDKVRLDVGERKI
jgi:hypothetical protein